MTMPASVPHEKGDAGEKPVYFDEENVATIKMVHRVLSCKSLNAFFSWISCKLTFLCCLLSVPFLPASEVPAEYHVVDYIKQETNNGGYVNSGVDITKNTTRIEFAVQDAEGMTQNGDCKIIGNGVNFTFATYNGSWRICTYQNKWQLLSPSSTTAPAKTPDRVDVTVSGNQWTFAKSGDDNSPYIYTASSPLTDGVHDVGRIYLFGNTSSASTPRGFRVFYLRIYKYVDDAEVLANDLVPVVRRGDGAVGFYDKVANAFRNATGYLKSSEVLKPEGYYSVEDEYDMSDSFDFSPSETSCGVSLFTPEVETCIQIPQNTYPSPVSRFQWNLRGWRLHIVHSDSTIEFRKGAGDIVRFTPHSGDQILVTLQWGRHLLVDPREVRRLKRDYRPVDYLMITNTATYIDTGYNLNQNISLVECALTSPYPNNNDARWFGDYSSNLDKFIFGCINGYWRICTKNNTWQQLTSVGPITGKPTEISVSDTTWTFKVNGGNTISYTSSSTFLGNSNSSIYIGKARNNGVGVKNAKFYFWRVNENTGVSDEVVHYFVPAVRKEDNVAGFYDLITDDFKIPTGGDFVPGPDTELPRSDATLFYIR